MAWTCRCWFKRRFHVFGRDFVTARDWSNTFEGLSHEGTRQRDQQSFLSPYRNEGRVVTRTMILDYVAQAHGGGTRVSDRPGGGAVITLSLPVSLLQDA